MKKMLFVVLLVVVAVGLTAWAVIHVLSNVLKPQVVRLVVDDDVIQSNDDFRVIEPVWWSVSIYDGEKQYNEDLAKFSLPQRYVFAIEWYMAEVNNGGHHQFYYNSTGIVWEDAMKGFEAIGAQENYDILRQSADLIGGNPSKDRVERQAALAKYSPGFDGLDNRYVQSENDLLVKLRNYIKANAKDFYFDGEVKMVQ